MAKSSSKECTYFVYVCLICVVLVCCVVPNAAQQCGLAVCYVVDASSSINSFNNGASRDTFQNVVKTFLQNLTSSIQYHAGGAAEFGGAWFGADATAFQANMTSSVSTVNKAIGDILCPPCAISCGSFIQTCTCKNSAGGAVNQCSGYPQYTNMDAGIRLCFNSATGGGILSTATPGKGKLILMITDGVPNRKVGSSPPWGSGTTPFAGLPATYNCGTCGNSSTNCGQLADDSQTSNPVSACAGTAAGLRAVGARNNGITFVSVGVTESVSEAYLSNISTVSFKVANFSSLLESVDDILERVCTDVGVSKRATPTSTTVGSNITYRVEMSNTGSYSVVPVHVPQGFIDKVPAGMTYLGPVISDPNDPVPTCNVTGSTAAGWSINCTTFATMEIGATWGFTYVVRADTPGNKTNVASLHLADSVESNNTARAVVQVFGTCSNPFGNGTRPNCPAGTMYAGADSQSISSSTVFGSICCTALDVRVTKSVSPTSATPGTNLTYTVTLSNVGGISSTAPNGFVDSLPAGLAFIGPVTSVSGAPTASCATSGSVTTGTTLNCTINSALALGANWTYTYRVQGNTTGRPVNTVQLTKLDGNATNSVANASVTLLGTCSNPLGDGSRLTCSAGSGYIGPDNRTLNSTSQFVSLCCGTLDVGISKSVSPSSGALGSNFTYTVTLSNVGPSISAKPNGFLDTLAQGMLFLGPITAGPGTPAADCSSTGSSATGTNVSCTVNADLPAGATWTYTYKVQINRSGSQLNRVRVVFPSSNASVTLLGGPSTGPGDSNPANDQSNVTVVVLSTCGDPFGNTTQGSCPVGQNYVGPDNAVLSNSSQFASACCAPFDVGITINVSPGSGNVGTNFTYTIQLSNPSGTNSTGPNGFVTTLPPGLTYGGQLIPANAGTPAASCSTNDTSNSSSQTISCSVAATLATNASWTYTFSAIGSTPGDKLVTTQLTKPDSNPANDRANVTVVLVSLTCGNPLGNGTQLSCPPSSGYIGPDGATISSAALFGTTCCAPFDVGITINVSPGSGNVGTNFTYTLQLSNPSGANSTGPNGFVTTLPPGLTYGGQLIPANAGTPAASCNTNGTSSSNGQTISCSVAATLATNAFWTYTFSATGDTPGDKLVTTQLTKPDSNPANDRANVTVVIASLTCGNPLGNGTQLSCPPSSGYIGPDGATISTAALFGTTCCAPFDVGITINVSPGSGNVGTDFTYAIQLSNPSGANSTGPNGFVTTLPPGITYGGQLIPANAGTPAASCSTNGTSSNNGQTITCSVAATLANSTSWTYTFSATGDTPGDKLVTTQLTKPDSNPANDRANVTIALASLTCGNPLGNGTQLSCPPSSIYMGPDGTTITSGALFGVTCCVAQAQLQGDAGVTVTPGVTIPLGGVANHTFTIRANGPGYSNGTGITISFPTSAGYLKDLTTAVDPAGLADYSIACSDPEDDTDIATGLTFTVVTCSLDNMAPGAAALVTMSFQPSAVGRLQPISGALSFTNPASDLVAGNNTASTWIDVYLQDVAVDINVNPTSCVVGGNLTYTMTLTNVGSVTSSNPNEFVITLPPGQTFVGPLTPVNAGTPAATCNPSGSSTSGQTVMCSVAADLAGNGTWTYTFPATGDTPGNKTVVVQLTKPDSNPANDRDDVTITVFGTCGSPFGNTTRLSCPAGTGYLGPDSQPLNSNSQFGSVCCYPQDVAVDINVNPDSCVVGGNLTYTMTLTNVGSVTSSNPNEFVITLPPGQTFVGPLTPVNAGTPAATCNPSGSSTSGQTVMCSVAADLAGNGTWTYTFPATGDTPGNKTVVVQLTKPDSNPANDRDNVTITVFGTCGNPFGNTTRLNCPAGTGYLGPDSKLLNSSSQFGSLCCNTMDASVSKNVSRTSVSVGSVVTYTVSMSNVGATGLPSASGFVDQLPPGIAYIGPVVAASGSPSASCTTSGTNRTGTNLTCSVNAVMPAGATWTYTYSARLITVGARTNRVRLVLAAGADSNPGNDNANATVTVLGICGNPFGNGTRLQCPPSTAYVGPDNVTLSSTAAFSSSCCISQAGLDGDAGVIVTPGRSYQLGTTVNIVFTITSNGPGFSNGTGINIMFPTSTGFTGSLRAVDPSGQVDYSLACSDPVSDTDAATNVAESLVGCFFGDMPAGSAVLVTLSFQPSAVGNYTPIVGDLTFFNEATDSNKSNNAAVTWLNVLSCPIYMTVVGNACQPTVCNPCPEPNPTVYLSTGNQGSPPNGLWRVPNFQAGNNSLTAEFLCTIGGIAGQIGDIALLHGGDVVVLGTGGELRYIPAASLPAPNTNFDGSVCNTLPLYSFTGYSGYTGLAVGYRSDILLASTGNGWVIPLSIKTDAASGSVLAAPLPSGSEEQPVFWACWYGSNTPTTDTALTNTGGTDLTPGPDGHFYRWCAKDSGMQYTGTRFVTTVRGYSQLIGSAEFVSNKLNPQTGGTAPFANAGAFCTSQYVVGTGTFSNPSNKASGSYAGFWSYGFHNGTRRSGFRTMTGTNPPAAPLISQTVPVLNVDGTVRIDGLRVNGAAVKPRCPA